MLSETSGGYNLEESYSDDDSAEECNEDAAIENLPLELPEELLYGGQGTLATANSFDSDVDDPQQQSTIVWPGRPHSPALDYRTAPSTIVIADATPHPTFVANATQLIAAATPSTTHASLIANSTPNTTCAGRVCITTCAGPVADANTTAKLIAPATSPKGAPAKKHLTIFEVATISFASGHFGHGELRHWRRRHLDNPTEMARARRRLAEEIMGKQSNAPVSIQGLATSQWRARQHPAAALLREYLTCGCPVLMGHDWALAELEAAVA